MAFAMALSGLALWVSGLALLGLSLCGLRAAEAGYEYVVGKPRSAQLPSFFRRLADSADRLERPRRLAPKKGPRQAQWKPFVNQTRIFGPNRFEYPAELVIVLSSNRSGAMNLTLDLARRHLCLYSCNEFFGDLAAIPCRRRVWHELWAIRNKSTLDSMREARDKLCSTKMPRCWHNPNVPNDVVKECSEQCATIVYLTDPNGIHGKRLVELLTYRGTRVIVLERDPAKRKCSLDWAKKNGDTSLNPLKHNYPALGTEASCPAEVPAHFLKWHKAWYWELRSCLEKYNISRLEINFDTYMHDREWTLRRIKKFAGL